MVGDVDKMINYLTKNNYEKYNEYIDGVYTAKNLSEDIGLKRHNFYLAVQKIDPEYNEKRKDIRDKRLKSIEYCIKNIVPYEYMDIDLQSLLGKDKYENKSSDSIKITLTVILKQNNNDTNGMKFMSWSTFIIWYKRYCIIKDIEASNPTIVSLQQKYGLSKTVIRKTRNFYKEEGRVLVNATPETESIFLRNLKLFKEYSNENVSYDELAKKYNIEPYIVPKIISSISDTKELVEGNE